MVKSLVVSFFVFLLIFSTLSARDSSTINHVTLHLKWKHQFQFAGYYAAKMRGFFREEGLDVDFIEGAPDKSASRAVLDGRADFGIGDADILLDRLKGRPLILVAPIFQHSPFIILSLNEKQITKPSDLIGKRLMISSNAATDLQIKYFLLRQNVPMSSLQEIPHTGNIQSLLENKADAMTAYSSFDPYSLKKLGVEYNILNGRMYGIDFYGDALFTSENVLNEKPEIVESFRKAALKGWKYAIEHKEEIIDSILKMNGVQERGIDREHLQFEAEQIERLIHQRLVMLGHINSDRLRRMAEAYVELNLVDNHKRLEGFAYVPRDTAAVKELFKMLIIIAAIAVLLILIAILWITHLRIMVNKRTIELSKKIVEKNQAETKYRLLFDKNPLPAIISEVETFRVLEVNSAALDFYEYTNEEFLSLTLKDLCIPEETGKIGLNTSSGPRTSYWKNIKKSGIVVDVEIISHNIQYMDKEAVLSLCMDITEKLKNEEAIKERDERLNLAMQASGISVWSWDIKNDFVSLDRFFPMVFGFDPGIKEKNYREILERIYPSDKILFKEKIFAAIKNGSEFSSEIRVNGTGLARNIIVRGKAFIDENGKTYRITGVCWDGTKQKVTENRIRKLNRLHSLTSHVNQTIVRVRDRDELLKDICRIVVKFGKYDTASISLLSENIDGMQLAAAEGNGKNFAIANSGMLNDEFKNHFLNKPGGDRYFLCNDIESGCMNGLKEAAIKEKFNSYACFPLFLGDKILGSIYLFSAEKNFFDREETSSLIEVSEDISFSLQAIEKDIQRVKAEKQLRTFSYIVEQSPVLILITNTSGIIEYVNKKFVQVTGYSLEDVIGRRPNILKSGKMPFDVYSDLWKTISAGKDWHGEFYNKKKSGELYWALSYISPVYDDKGVITHYLGISEDITERREIEKQLVQAKENAEKSDLLKTEFLAQMSHEIRTPINAILSFTSLIKEELSDKINDELKSSFSILDRAGNRIIRTIDLILHMSELQTGSYEFTPKIFDVYSDVLLKLYVNFKKSARDKNLEFTLQKEAESALIYADENKIYEIFNNLIDNAIKYTARGNVHILLGKNIQGKLYIQVKDTGIGMSEEFLSNLFKLFVQEEQGYTRRFEGNGLGLALVKKYCDLNQADIQVKSKKGEGSVFTVTFSN